MRAKKSLGQNFLHDAHILQIIASAIPIAGKHIIEVGPGHGALTEYILANNPEILECVEFDTDLLVGLRARFLQYSNFSLIHQDILQFVPQAPLYSVIANIPYYITSPILMRFLYTNPCAPQEMVLMMQREFGDKILLGNGENPRHSLLSLALFLVCSKIERVCNVPRTSFDPVPKVDSVVLRFTVKQHRNREEEQEMLNFWKQVFLHPRKTLISHIRHMESDEGIFLEQLAQLGYSPQVRAEVIRLQDWKYLFAVSRKK